MKTKQSNLKFHVALVPDAGLIKDGALMLLDEHGAIVGSQQRVVVSNGVGEVSTVTVTFVLDDHIRLGGPVPK